MELHNILIEGDGLQREIEEADRLWFEMMEPAERAAHLAWEANWFLALQMDNGRRRDEDED